MFNTPVGGVDHDAERHVKIAHDGRSFVRTAVGPEVDERTQEWDGEEVPLVQEQGSRADFAALAKGRPGSDEKTVEWVQEPALEASQYVCPGGGGWRFTLLYLLRDRVEEMENQIGGGLIEEVIQVAEGELKLVDEMLKAKVWVLLYGSVWAVRTLTRATGGRSWKTRLEKGSGSILHAISTRPGLRRRRGWAARRAILEVE